MASLSSVAAASSCSLHKHQSKPFSGSSSTHTASKSTKNFIVSHTSYEQRIDPSLPLCCAINSIQTTVTTNFLYREVFPSAILPTLCCEPENSSEAAATPEEDDDIFYYYSTSDLPGTVGGKELLYREEEGDNSKGSSSHKLDRKHISSTSPVRSYLLIESMGSGSSTTAAAASNRRSTNVGISASHGNILTKPPKSSKHHIRRSSFSSDNGGFDIIPTPSAASKSSHMGVRERLRSSLDKISFKPAFRWGSSDKIQSNFNNGSSSQSKSKNKTSRRSADSPRVRTVAATPEPQSAAIKQQHKHRSRNVESACSELERIGDIMCKSAEQQQQQQHNNHHHMSKNGQHLVRQHRVTNHHHHNNNGGECERASSNLPDYIGIPSSHHTSASNSVANSVMNLSKSVDDRKRLAAGNESYQAIAFDYAETLKTNREAITRAKGTWSMLRTNNNPQTRYRPVKASTGVLHPVVVSGSMDVLSSSETMHSIASDSRRKKMTESSNVHTTSPPTKQDVCIEEPPKIMPVSGKLLQQQYVETTILRPTAFKVVPRRQESPPQAPPPPPARTIRESCSSDVIIMPNDHHPQAHQGSRSALSSRKSCASDSNSDSGLLCSGRNSSSSLPAAGASSTGEVGNANTSSNTSGGNVSCSASSEGYDSAGVPHNNQTETEINCADASPLVLHKFANGESLQIHDDDVVGQTAHDNGNTSENDEYAMMTNGNDGKDVAGYHHDSKHIVNDKYDDAHYSNAPAQQQQQQSQRYSNDPMLPATTIDLTSVIRPSSSEATLHIITQQHKAQHQHATLDLRSRLDDYECEMQQRRGEISHLKGQVKDLQGELSHRTTEIVTLRARNRSLFARVAARDRQLADTMSRLDDREATCSELQRRLHEAEDDAAAASSLTRDRRCHVTSSAWPAERDALLKRLGEVEERYMEQSRQFEVERQQWIVDKTRVVRYQKQLQDNYMHLYKRSRDLEQENNLLANKLRHLTMTSASSSSSMVGEKRLMNGGGDDTSSTALSYPMDI